MKQEAEQLAEKNSIFVKSEIALKLLGKKVDIKTISETTGLSIEEIEKLRSGD